MERVTPILQKRYSLFSRCWRAQGVDGGGGEVLAAADRAVERKIAFVDLVSQLRLEQDFSRALAHPQLLFNSCSHVCSIHTSCCRWAGK